MGKIIIQLSEENNFVSNAVRMFTRGRKSHAAILMGGYLYESHYSKGVIKKRITTKGLHSWQDYEFESLGTYEEVETYLNAQIGRKYGFAAILGFVLRFIPRKSRSVICSELGFEVLQKILKAKIDYNKKLVSPTNLTLVLETLVSVNVAKKLKEEKGNG